MNKMLSVTFNGEELSVADGSRIEQLFDHKAHPGTLPPIGAIVNKRVVGLSYPLHSNAEIETIDVRHREGADIYRRTASILLFAACRELFGDAKIRVGQSIASSAYFFDFDDLELNKDIAQQLSVEMQRMIDEDLRIEIESTNLVDAIEILKDAGMETQAKLLMQLGREEVSLLRLGKYTSLLLGPIGHHTGMIKDFCIKTYQHSLVLCFPDEEGNLQEDIPDQPRLYKAYDESKKWNQVVKTRHVADLNEHCITGEVSSLIRINEALLEKRLASIADQIAANDRTKLILIGGPSSSGKTTSCKRLSIHLRIHGLEPVMLSMDDYFLSREETPKHPDGSYNFDCLEALDVPLLNQHLEALLRGEEVDTPIFSFQMGRRFADKFHKMKLEKHQVLIMEGIHGMNDAVSMSVARDQKFKMYVSPLTQLCIDPHNRIFATDTRLIRRIIRDRMYRGHNAAQTIEGWPSVRAGESQYIFPFQEEADVIFDTSHLYECALLKPYAERFLAEVPPDHPSFLEANRLMRFFQLFIPVLEDEVPRTSILREFIGGSSFKY